MFPSSVDCTENKADNEAYTQTRVYAVDFSL